MSPTATLTADQKAKLHAAIDAAKGPGECQYVIDGQPGCVIGQLAVACGVTVDDMARFDADGSESDGSAQRVEAILGHPLVTPLRRFPDTLLRELQRAWDRNDGHSEASRRIRMHTLVEEYPTADQQEA